MMKPTSKEEFRRIRDGIPAFIHVPAQQSNDDGDESSLSSLEGSYRQRHRDGLIQVPSIKLRTQSLPIRLSAVQQAIMSSSDSRLPPALTISKTTFDEDEDSMDGLSMSHMDRPPRVPQRRQSIPMSSSCPPPMSVVVPLARPPMSLPLVLPVPYRHKPKTAGTIRRALAA